MVNTKLHSLNEVVVRRSRRCARSKSTFTPSSPCPPTRSLNATWYQFKFLSYVILVAIALLAPLNSFAYEYDAREGKWVARAKFGGFIADSKENGVVGGVDIGKVSDDKFFGSNFYAELESDYFLFDRLSLGAFVGYMPQNAGVWTFASAEDTGSVSVIPIGAIAKFHIAPYGEIRPYVGAGYYYGIVRSSYEYLEFESTSGPVFAGGLDWWFDRDWALNLEAKKFIMTVDMDASEFTEINDYKVESEVNPLTLTIGITHRF